MMDALQRDQDRVREASTSVRPPPPPPVSRANVIDLTSEDAFGPIPSSSQSSRAALHDGFQRPTSRPLSSTSGFKSWQLPGRNKHVGPSKVKMLDTSSLYTPSHPSQATSAGSTHLSSSSSSSSASTVHRGPAPEVIFMGHQKNTSKTSVPPITAQSVDLSRDSIVDEVEPPPPIVGYADVSSAEREQQLQDMLSSMVNPVENGEIDFEKAKKVAGLQCDLMPHQVAGLLWMKEREGGRFKGGILADDMGLGKTIQTLALIVANSPTNMERTIDTIRQIPGEVAKKSVKKNGDVVAESAAEQLTLKSKTTLILAPLAVIRQWEREAKEKTKPNLRVLVHHGTSRAKSAAVFPKYDVVVTTYTTAASEWGNFSGDATKKGKKGARKTKGKKSLDSSDEESEESESDSGSSSDDDDDDARILSKPVKAVKRLPAPLFEAQWLRVVLDEAQNIKNHRTKASIACAALSRNALSKWCLSGTPIQNDALEMFSLIRFLGIPPFDEYAHFKDKISDPLKSTNQNRVNWGMKRLCVVLRTIMLRRTKDTMHEGKPLITLPTRTVNIISSDFDNEDEKRFYQKLESQVQKKLEDAEDGGHKVSQMATLLMLLRLRQACSHPLLLTRHVKTDAVAASVSAALPAAKNGSTSTNGVSNGGNDDDDDDGGLADLLAGLSVVTKSCDRCQAVLPKCDVHEKYCMECRQAIEQEAQRGIDWNGKSSTKIRLMLKLLEEIRTGSGGEKTIIFSQFTSFLDLLEPFLRKEGHRYVRYDGSMRADERERSLERVRNESNIKVILISFMAGSTGLNLTCCSRVILMDLWWNPQLEEQAFDRSHRLGQQRPVQIYKLTINKSVEERILELQTKKRALAKAALEGSKFSKANKLDKKELMYLFSGSPIA